MNNRENSIRNRFVGSQLLRYAATGAISNAAGYFVYLVITYFGMSPKYAMSFLYAVGATVGFFGNRRLTFSYKGRIFGSGVRYLIAHALGYLMNLAILIVFVDVFGYAHQLVQAVAVFAVAAFLFVAFKYFVFRTTEVGAIGETK